MIRRIRNAPFLIAGVAWLDLLGYGSQLRAASFDPTDPRAKDAVDRLRLFHYTAATCADRNFPVMPINDGAAAFRNISAYGRSVTYDFLRRSIDLFDRVNAADSTAGYWGARMVVAVGFRINYRARLGEDTARRMNILRRLEEGTITPNEAVHEAFQARPVYGFVEELQANFAFTKAYMVDEAGSKAGFGGANCFIDLTMFEDQLPSWIEFSRIVDWKTDGMQGRFGELVSLDRDAAGAVYLTGILDAKEIRKRLEALKH